jgi:hypothetical protein
MASLALSVVGTAIGGPIGGMIGGAIGGLIDNVLFPTPTTPPPAITSSTYGQALPRAWGPTVRLGGNMIRTSGWYKQTGKDAKLASLKGLPPSYLADIAVLVMDGPVDPDWCFKILANGSVLFDASKAGSPPVPDANGVVTYTKAMGTHKDFETLTVYPGNATQLPDPTLESRFGMGEVTAYRGSCYVVIKGLSGTPYGNAVPLLNFLCRPHAVISIGQVVSEICDRCGVDPTTISTSSLTTRIRGYVVDSQTDGVTALQPLGLCYDFDISDICGSLRFVPRGDFPLCTITNGQIDAYEGGGSRPQFQWPRVPEMDLPKLAALTFADVDRDCNDNTQSDKRLTGSSQNQLQTRVRVSLTSDEARKIAARMLWEAQYGRQTFTAATDDRLGFLEAARTYAVEVPNGYETIRITRRSRGANNVITFDAKRDAPSVYISAAPSASAQAADNLLGLGGPVNTPVFIEPPADFPGINGQTLLIGLSGGDGTTANDAWGGCQVYVATDDVDADFQLAGLQIGPSCMGVTFATTASGSGSNPDNTHTVSVDTSMSNGEPNPTTDIDAGDALTPYIVGGEFMTAVNVTALGADQFHLTKLYRGLYGTSKSSHAIGEDFVRIDSSVFHWPIPIAYLGRTLYFRFVSAGESLGAVTTYTYAPTGHFKATEDGQAIPASEAIAAGAAVNLYSDAGVLTARNAVATDTSKPANGFVRDAVSSGGTAVVFPQTGKTNDSLTGLTPGAAYFLDPTTPGTLTTTAPTTVGQSVQPVGVALSSTSLQFEAGTAVAVPATGGGGGGGSRMLFDLGTMPALSSFTQVAVSGSVSVVENPGKAITIINSAPPNDSGLFTSGIALPAPGSTPYRVAVFALPNSAANNYANVGVGIRDSSTGKIDLMGILMSIGGSSGSFGQFENDTFNSPTVRAGATGLGKSANNFSAGVWLAVRDDGTNIHWEYSADGATFVTILTKAHGAFVATADEIYLGVEWDENIFGGLQQSVSFLACDVNGLTRVVG